MNNISHMLSKSSFSLSVFMLYIPVLSMECSTQEIKEALQVSKKITKIPQSKAYNDQLACAIGNQNAVTYAIKRYDVSLLKSLIQDVNPRSLVVYKMGFLHIAADYKSESATTLLQTLFEYIEQLEHPDVHGSDIVPSMSYYNRYKQLYSHLHTFTAHMTEPDREKSYYTVEEQGEIIRILLKKVRFSIQELQHFINELARDIALSKSPKEQHIHAHATLTNILAPYEFMVNPPLDTFPGRLPRDIRTLLQSYLLPIDQCVNEE